MDKDHELTPPPPALATPPAPANPFPGEEAVVLYSCTFLPSICLSVRPSVRPSFYPSLTHLSHSTRSLIPLTTGYVKSQYKLGLLFATGRGSIDQDLANSVRWFGAAADRGYAKAQHKLGVSECSEGSSRE